MTRERPKVDIGEDEFSIHDMAKYYGINLKINKTVGDWTISVLQRIRLDFFELQEDVVANEIEAKRDHTDKA